MSDTATLSRLFSGIEPDLDIVDGKFVSMPLRVLKS